MITRMRRGTLALLISIVLLCAACGGASESPEGTAMPVPDATDGIAQAAETPVADDGDEAVRSEDAPEPSAPRYLLPDEFPNVDGTSAAVPLSRMLARVFGGMSEAEADAYTIHSGYAQSYYNLLYGDAELLLTYAPTADTEALIMSSGALLRMEPVAKDALVFIVNEQNPVAGLSREQLTSIYMGHTSDWARVGGADGAIIPYQREPSVGSHSLFMSLLMDGHAPIEPLTEPRLGGHGVTVQAVSAFDNAPGALGYTTYQYASSLYRQTGVRMLDVDGITPARATIVDGSYPLATDIYAVIHAGAPQESSAYRLFAFLTTPEGRALIGEAGYAAAE